MTLFSAILSRLGVGLALFSEYSGLYPLKPQFLYRNVSAIINITFNYSSLTRSNLLYNSVLLSLIKIIII